MDKGCSGICNTLGLESSWSDAANIGNALRWIINTDSYRHKVTLAFWT